MKKIDPKTISLFKEIANMWEPNVEMTISEWADENRFLTSEASDEPGRFKTDRTPYAREIMNCINDPNVTEVAIMASAQVGKTEILLNTVGFFADQEPCPMLYMLPDKQLIRAASQERITPMIEASPVLKKKFAKAKGRSSSNTITKKSFVGGYLAIVGANSPAALSSRPVRIVLADEVDRFPVSAGTEGDPIKLATKRTTTFHKRKHIFCSTPLVEQTSRINKLYEESTQERWCIACPSCGSHQALEWDMIKFQRDDSGNVIKVDAACRECGTLSTEKSWKKQDGKWIARRKHAYRRGFHLNQLVSPWVSWSKVVTEFLEAKDDPEMLQVWTNTVLGQPWTRQGEKLDEQELNERGEIYVADIPEGVKILLATVDTQDNRFEIEVKGWGAGKESWGIQYQVIHGDLNQNRIWEELDEFLKRSWKDVQGRRFKIAAVAMDSGGHFTNDVYKFCRKRLGRRVYALKGEGKEFGGYIPLFNGITDKNRYKAPVMRVGVDEGKFKVQMDLKRKMFGPGYCHYPANSPGHDNRGYNEAYFQGLTAETLISQKKQGVTFQQWVKMRDRNEPLDLHVYQLALLEMFNPNLDDMLPQAVGDTVDRTVNTVPMKPRRRGATSSI